MLVDIFLIFKRFIYTNRWENETLIALHKINLNHTLFKQKFGINMFITHVYHSLL